MISIIKENFYNIDLISKVKKQTGPKKIKKILENLRCLSEEDVKRYPEFKVKIFEEEGKEDEKNESIIAVPVVGLKHYIEDCKKLDSKSNVNNNIDYERKKIPSNVDDNEQIDSSDFSKDE